MTRRFLSLLLLCTAAGCGGPLDDEGPASIGSQSNAIIDGMACTSDQYPSAVAILPQMTVTLNGQSLTLNTVACTGTLIAPDVVVAAGHCVDPAVYQAEFASVGADVTLDKLDFYVSFQADLQDLADANSNDLPANAVHVIKYVRHPQYSLPDASSDAVGPQDLHDISLLFLAAAQKPEPAIVISKDEATQIVSMAPVEIVGWGQQTPDQLPSAGTIGQKECAQSFINQLGDSELQIGGDASTPRKCHGDSGGPTFLTVKTKLSHTERLIGVTSHSYDQTDCQKGGIDTRIDSYLDWIDQTMQGACADKTRVWCDVKGIIPASYYEKSKGCASADASLLTLLPLALWRLRRRRR